MTIYMAVTPDEYELPIYVCDSLPEMSKRFNLTKNNISTKISKGSSGKITGVKFVRVKVEE